MTTGNTSKAFAKLKEELGTAFPRAIIRNPHDRQDVIECFLAGQPVADTLVIALVDKGVALSLENNNVPIGGAGYSNLDISLSYANVGVVISEAKKLMCVPV